MTLQLVRLSPVVLAAALTFGCAPVLNVERRAVNLDPKTAAVIDEAPKLTRGFMGRRIPGLSVVVVNSDSTLWEAGFGAADRRAPTPVDPDTLFSVQSMSKVYTAIGVLTAVRDGIVELDAPISRYVSDFHVHSIFEAHPEQRITLRHLLTHTAGLTMEAPVGGNFDLVEPSFDDHVASITATWLKFPVGERYAYSNLGIDLAAYVVERTSGVQFSRYMHEKVFDPLGMTRTSLDFAWIEAQQNRAIGHDVGARSVPVFVSMLGAGGVYTSAHDLGIFLRFLLGAGRNADSILDESLFRELETTPNHGGTGLAVAVSRFRDDLYFTHGGGGYGFLSTMSWLPTYDVGIGVLTNSTNHDQYGLQQRLVDELVAKGAVTRRGSLDYLPVCGINLGQKDSIREYFRAHHDQTLFRPQWSKYLGDWKLPVARELNAVGRVATRLALMRDFVIHLRKSAEGMTLNGSALLEYEPGFFFTDTGEALDFRSDPPTWRNVAISRRQRRRGPQRFRSRVSSARYQQPVIRVPGVLPGGLDREDAVRSMK